MIVRPATPDDLPWLHAQCRAFSAFIGSRRPLYEDEGHVDATLRQVMAFHVCLVAERDGLLTGVAAGILVPHFMNPAIMTLCEVLWWVPEEYRGGRAALQLLEAFLAVGKQRANWVSFSLEAKTPVDERVLLKRGFRLSERNYLLEVA